MLDIIVCILIISSRNHKAYTHIKSIGTVHELIILIVFINKSYVIKDKF